LVKIFPNNIHHQLEKIREKKINTKRSYTKVVNLSYSSSASFQKTPEIIHSLNRSSQVFLALTLQSNEQ